MRARRSQCGAGCESQKPVTVTACAQYTQSVRAVLVVRGRCGRLSVPYTAVLVRLRCVLALQARTAASGCAQPCRGAATCRSDVDRVRVEAQRSMPTIARMRRPGHAATGDWTAVAARLRLAPPDVPGRLRARLLAAPRLGRPWRPSSRGRRACWTSGAAGRVYESWRATGAADRERRVSSDMVRTRGRTRTSA